MTLMKNLGEFCSISNLFNVHEICLHVRYDELLIFLCFLSHACDVIAVDLGLLFIANKTACVCLL